MNSRELIPATQISAEPIKSGKKFVNDKGITAKKMVSKPPARIRRNGSKNHPGCE
jgi:hypothetical protein